MVRGFITTKSVCKEKTMLTYFSDDDDEDALKGEMLESLKVMVTTIRSAKRKTRKVHQTKSSTVLFSAFLDNRDFTSGFIIFSYIIAARTKSA